ncbi:CNNM domain-containing protein [Planococcus shenhongbingii]|uniref:CNNM domain-containing protein n=1 Tax=Planococcus shenhongbingii TaxID=3058398 RepID=A0ABT8NAC6_9BACL|nr:MULTISPECIES: CNNM domain-containing protein [unclassified Planococcus (in: firmicutes)]MDN7244841.1 CNNM domain-containing protein [Planococcus sp. N017]WKA57959.1 CNNM domain-containing protein [Planococcus sp. N016]
MFIALGICLVMSFFFSGSETALTAVNRMKVHLRAEQGDAKSLRVRKLIAKPDRMITTILIGNNIVNILMPTLVTTIALTRGWEVGLATAILTVIIIIFGEVLPKTIAATFADRLVYVVAPAISFFVIIFKPLTWLLSKFTNIFIRIISKGTVKEATLTKEELRSMVDIASTEGTFAEEESERIKGILDFPNKDVSDVMSTHRTDTVGIAIDSTYEEVRDLILSSAYTRYPVYEESLDNIVGLFYSKKLIEWSMNPNLTIAELMDDNPLFVVQSVSVEKVFKMMMSKKKHMAVILDEYGGTLGIVTHEDIIEEMIGQEIEDETDVEDDELVFEITETQLSCHGRLEIEDVNDMFDVEVPNDHDTIAGFVMQQLGHVPDEGEEFTYENLHVKVDEMDRNRIIRLTITKLTDEEIMANPV